MAILKLAEHVAKKIREHGARDYPNETCGALFGYDQGSGREVRALLSLTNRRDDSPGNRFSITPKDFRVAEHAASKLGLELVGWYHSHPDHPARPSEFDREHAWPWYSYVIVSVTAGQPEDTTSWLLAEDRSHFDPEEIAVGRRDLSESRSLRPMERQGDHGNHRGNSDSDPPFCRPAG